MLDRGRSAAGAGRSNGDCRSYDSFEQGLIVHRPNLTAYACHMARDPDVADDMVQETVIRALEHRKKFIEGTNQRAWLFTILKNVFRSKMRRGTRETELTDIMANTLLRTSGDMQERWVELKEVSRHLARLPGPQARAIVLVGVQGHSVDEAARIENCQSGTIKSRVSRGRMKLKQEC
ncbi:MAG: sigma-70 family RNA polymerase sigma factor [Silicimonas sp.]|jgi:RNA polymerase sigma-70 factor (ECF subfamily)|nr:sigma-70 family RNA polymerase sigma factor [Silicimonas sp.]